MLILARSLRELRFSELMEVYADSNLEKAENWPDLPRGLALQLAEQEGMRLPEISMDGVAPESVCRLYVTE